MAYESVLRAAGWRYRFDVGEVQAWEHAAVTAAVTPPPPDDRAAALWWGVMPLLALALAAGLLATKFAQINLRVVRHALLAVTVALLSFWWVTVLRPETEALPQIYFTYESVLLFASDVALTLTLAIWIVECVVRRQAPLLPAPLYLIPFATLLSTLTSVDPTLTLAFTLHLCLLAGLFVMLVNDPPAATTMGRWFGAALLLQCGLALAQAVAQNTFMLHDLYLRWPGEVEAAMRGASVAANANGDRWLRAYGTLPHPNVLGAMLLAYAGAAWERWLTAGRRVWLILLMLSALAIGLTLSRAAWLGAAVMIVALWLWLPRGAIARWRGATSVCALAAIALLLPLASFVMSRTGVTGDSNALERASTLERSLLTGFAFDAFRAQPLTGVGAAGFVQWAANTLPERYPFQPVHSVPLLILAETGLFGAATLSACVMLIAWRMWQRRHVMSVAEAVWAAVLAGIGVTALFDHLWYTQAPARTLLAFALALWCVSRQAAETQSG
jgi:O-antigen ligase